MLRRVESVEATIRGAHQTVVKAVSEAGSSYKSQAVEVAEAMSEFDSFMSTLRPCFVNSPEAQLRNACCVLAQIFAAKNSDADCDWLGLPDSLVKTGRNVLEVRLRSWRGPQIYFVIANAFSELAKLYEEVYESSEVDEAIAQCRLVIDEKSLRVWWDQNELLIGLSPIEFRALLLLAKGASGQRVISESDVYSDSGSRSRWPTMISRLKKRLPAGLKGTILKGEVRSTYRIDLSGEQVHVARR